MSRTFPAQRSTVKREAGVVRVKLRMENASAIVAAPLPAAEVAVGFDGFYTEQYSPLLRLAYVSTGSRAVAEELVQETMLRVLRHWRKVGAYEKPGAWARRVLLNLATSRGRRLAVEARVMCRLVGEHAVEPEPSAETTALWSAVRALPSHESHAITLHYLEDMSVVDMAEVLEMPEGSVKTLLHRARRQLAAALGEDEE